MIKGKIFCWVFLLAFFNSKSAGLSLGRFYNTTEKAVELEISRLQDNNKSLRSKIPAVKIRVAKGSSVKLDHFSFETPEGPSSGFLITYYFVVGKKISRNNINNITIKYKHLVIDDKNCSKCGLCPSGYMASFYLGPKLYKNVYSPISQKGHGSIDLTLSNSGVSLGGNVQVLEPGNALMLNGLTSQNMLNANLSSKI